MYPSPMSTSHSPYTASAGYTIPGKSVQHQNSSQDTIPSGIASALRRKPTDPILWFANPPMNVPPLVSTPVHSISYLAWKQQQQQQQS